jgi:hypothetical protein
MTPAQTFTAVGRALYQAEHHDRAEDRVTHHARDSFNLTL